MAPQRKRQRPDDYFVDWKEREALAESMIPIVGTLAREKNVKCYIYGNSLVNLSVLDIMKTHRWVRQVEDNELSEFETIRVIEAMAKLNLGPSHIDIGRLSVEYFDKHQGEDLSLESAGSIHPQLSSTKPQSGPRATNASRNVSPQSEKRWLSTESSS